MAHHSCGVQVGVASIHSAERKRGALSMVYPQMPCGGGHVIGGDGRLKA